VLSYFYRANASGPSTGVQATASSQLLGSIAQVLDPWGEFARVTFSYFTQAHVKFRAVCEVWPNGCLFGAVQNGGDPIIEPAINGVVEEGLPLLDLGDTTLGIGRACVNAGQLQ